MPRKKKLRCVKCGEPHSDPQGGLCYRCATAGVSDAATPPQVAAGLAPCVDCSTLNDLLDRTDGWLRVIPRSTGEYSLKWRFTSGAWSGHYVFWQSGKCETLASAFRGLLLKLYDVDGGHLRPSLDDRVYR